MPEGRLQKCREAYREAPVDWRAVVFRRPVEVPKREPEPEPEKDLWGV